MSLRTASIAAYIVMVLGIVWLSYTRQLFARSPLGIAIEVGASCLAVWARVTFGLRSFHAAANPTRGGLVTTGPYGFIRHPIYVAVCLFAWAGALDHHTAGALAAALLVTASGAVRMFSEERLLLTMYPDYASYRSRTARVVPFLF